MANKKPQGPKVGSNLPSINNLAIRTEKWSWVGGVLDGQEAGIFIFTKIEAWRDHAYYDKQLHIKFYMDSESKYMATNKYTHDWEAIIGIQNKKTRFFYESGYGQAPFPPQLVSEGIIEHLWSGTNPIEIIVENTDRRDSWIEQEEKENDLIPDATIYTYETGRFSEAYVKGYVHAYDVGSHTASKQIKADFFYPPYREIVDNDEHPDPPPVGSNTGGKDIGKGTENETVTISSTYSISRVGDTQSVSWTPNGTSGNYGESITNKVIVDRVGNSNSSPYNFTTPSPVASTYNAYVERYYTNYPDIMTRSNTLSLKTYSKPSLTGITLSKYTLSPRAGTTLGITFNGINNRTHSIENNFRSGIWSNIKGKYYIDEVKTGSYRELSLDEIKTMFPDTSAVNGIVNGTVYGNRRNLGVNGGNPGNGQLVYETNTYSRGITIKYTPTETIDPNKEPNNDPSSSGLRYNKRENKTQGAKLTAGHTWVLPNTYNISSMDGVDVTIQYPKTDSSGVLSGYRIRLYSANDGSPHANEKYYEHHFDTTNYTDTFLIPYNDIRRGVSGNIIEITPYYTSSSGARWYGPTISKKFVDIAWMLNDPVIDCPLTGTTWHNHQYRVLFKLPIDRDTNYKGQNDIEFYYGAGTYRYQEIQIDINGTVTTIGNNAYMNAQNNWNGPININNAKLTYLRKIIINQSLIPTYNNTNYYMIRIRVRKAYGQNPNWDGWSNWSQYININKQTVSNENVLRHQTIMASHYMNVQNAFNRSTACYAKTASDNQNFVIKESFDRSRGDNINGPHLSPPQNTPLGTVKEYVSEFNDLHQMKNKINSYGTFDTDKNRNPVKLDYQNKLLATFVPSQEFITAEKDQNGATECDSPTTILKGGNYMKYMCDELNNLW